MPAKLRMASRYERMECRTILLRRLRSNPRLRAAISMLAPRRFTSHSKGPGKVSSKSFTSNTRSRSGEAKPPKFTRCASPQSCTCNGVRGAAARSAARTLAAPR